MRYEDVEHTFALVESIAKDIQGQLEEHGHFPGFQEAIEEELRLINLYLEKQRNDIMRDPEDRKAQIHSLQFLIQLKKDSPIISSYLRRQIQNPVSVCVKFLVQCSQHLSRCAEYAKLCDFSEGSFERALYHVYSRELQSPILAQFNERVDRLGMAMTYLSIPTESKELTSAYDRAVPSYVLYMEMLYTLDEILLDRENPAGAPVPAWV